MKKLVSILLGVFMLLVVGFKERAVEPKLDTNAKIKAVFIYNFTKYIEWPVANQDGEFKIGILGENQALYNELDKMSKIKKVANRSFSINTYSNIKEAGLPHILYIPEDNTEILEEAVARLKGKSTLIVTEKSGMAGKGSGINFVIVENRQKFELNKNNISQHNLKVASVLEKLGVLVN